MGWSSANQILDPVARVLQEAGSDDTTKQKVLGNLNSHEHNVHLGDDRCFQRARAVEGQDRIADALARKFAGGAPEGEIYAEMKLAGCEERHRDVTPQVAIDAIRDLLGSGHPDGGEER